VAAVIKAVRSSQLSAAASRSSCRMSGSATPYSSAATGIANNSVQVDLVGGREETRSDPVDFVGAIKWRGKSAFGRSDLAQLNAFRSSVSGTDADTRLIGVSRTGFSVAGLDVELTAEDILAAYA